MSIKDMVVKRIISLCKNKDISLNKLSNLSGVTLSTIYSIVDKTRKEIGITILKKLCDGLEITISDFFNTEDFKNLEQEIK